MIITIIWKIQTSQCIFKTNQESHCFRRINSTMLKGGFCLIGNISLWMCLVHSEQEREDLHFHNLAINSNLVLPFPISHVPACLLHRTDKLKPALRSDHRHSSWSIVAPWEIHEMWTDTYWSFDLNGCKFRCDPPRNCNKRAIVPLHSLSLSLSLSLRGPECNSAAPLAHQAPGGWQLCGHASLLACC